MNINEQFQALEVEEIVAELAAEADKPQPSTVKL